MYFESMAKKRADTFSSVSTLWFWMVPISEDIPVTCAIKDFLSDTEGNGGLKQQVIKAIR
jgi:hypothetical protein